MNIIRRTFLKNAGLAGGASVAGDFLFNKLFQNGKANAAEAGAAEAKGDKVAFSGCYTCLGRCTLQVQVAPGDIPRYVTGDIEGPINEGAVCALGAGSPMHYLSPARMRFPLLRKPTAERGEGKFVRVGWQDMLDIMVQGDEADFLKKRGWSYGFLGMKAIREKFPEKLAYYTGRDQYNPTQNGMFGATFGTPNQGGHGGFCSANVAIGGAYVAGGTWWEAGHVDPHHCQLVVLAGVAQDHFPNGTRRLLTKLRSQGARFVSIAPDRYPNVGPLVDEWLPIEPGTDGAFVLSLMQELLRLHDLGMAKPSPEPYIDEEYLRWYSNSAFLVMTNADGSIDPPEAANTGLFARVKNSKGDWAPAVWGTDGKLYPFDEVPWQQGVAPDLNYKGQITVQLSPDTNDHITVQVATSFSLLRSRVADSQWSPDKVADITGLDAAAIRKLARDMGDTAMRKSVWVPGKWQDYLGRSFDGFIGRPVGIYAMRGVSSHSNGFQAGRDYMILSALLGAIDSPGSFRYKSSAPWAHVDGSYWPSYANLVDPRMRQDNGVVGGTAIQERVNNDGSVTVTAIAGKSPAVGASTKPFIYTPSQLVVDENGLPMLLDRSYSWDAPLAMHRAFTAVNYDAGLEFPHRVEMILWHIANPYWDNAYDIHEDLELVRRKHQDGRHTIPFVAIVDTFYGNSVPFCDLVIPDLTFFERFGAHSLVDRPISTVDGPADSIHWPVLPALYGVKSWADTLITLGEMLKIPAFLTPDGNSKYPKGYEDFLWKWETSPNSGIGMLAGARGDGTEMLRAKPNPKQLETYMAPGFVPAYGDSAHEDTFPRQAKFPANTGELPPGVASGQQSVGHANFQYTLPVEIRYRRNVNAGYLKWAKGMGFIPHTKPILANIYSEVIQKFRLAGHGKWKGANATFLAMSAAAAAKQDTEGQQRYHDLAVKNASPPDDERGQHLRRILKQFYDPLPSWYEPLEWASDGSDAKTYPIRTEGRHVNPWFYHQWQNHNPWNRPMLPFSPIYMNVETAKKYNIAKGDWVEFESRSGERVRGMVDVTEATRPNVVWYWKGRNVRGGTLAISPDSPEVKKGVMFNDVYQYRRPKSWGGELSSGVAPSLLNLDPFTAQTVWGDLRLRVIGKSPIQESSYGFSDPLLKMTADRDFMPQVDQTQVIQFSAYKQPSQVGINWYDRKVPEDKK